MRKSVQVGLALGGGGLALVLAWSWHDALEAATSLLRGESDLRWRQVEDLREESLVGGRMPLEPERPATPVALPAARSSPTNEQELIEFVRWMRGLDHDELLRLSNAEFGFEKSELIERLQGLRGDWVVQALGDLAVAEEDPLLRAILVKGLAGGAPLERAEDPRLVPILDALITRMSRASEDPYAVAHDLAMCAYMASVRQDQDYVSWMSGLLASSDNPRLLGTGYLLMGTQPGSEGLLKEMLTAHADSAGRFGALEGLRGAATRGRIAPAEITALGLQALETETDDRNRLLLYEMMISTGGEEALAAVEDGLRSGRITEIDKTVQLLAMKMEPARAQALLQDLLRERELDGPAKQAVFNALALVPGDGGVDVLFDLVRNGDESERLAGLRGLWNRPVDERVAGELHDLFDRSKDGALRTEALRMLAYDQGTASSLDLRTIASLDDDAGVRAEAIQLAAMQPSPDTRAWLEQRLHEDGSLDVKAAALGALVFQAHYAGDGEAVLGYLERARKFTSDESALAMIAEGERMVRDQDPRNLELGLAGEAEFWGTVAKYTSGPAARDFERRAQQLGQIVTALRTTRDTRRPAR